MGVSDTCNPRVEVRELALEAIRRLLLWMADTRTLHDRGVRATHAASGVQADGQFPAHQGIRAMNAKNSTATEINRLHAEVERLAVESKTALTSALAAAWRAGRLLSPRRSACAA